MARCTKSQINILVADDDDDDCLLVKEALREALPNVHVHFTADGEALFDYLHHCEHNHRGAERSCPDLILLDLNMPRMDGRDVLRQIKADDRFKCIPVVVFSTSIDMRDIDFSYRHGASSYLKKPHDFQELVRVMAVLGAYWFNAAELPAHDFHLPADISVKPKLTTTILIVDDSAFARKVLSQITRLAGHNVLEADDGETALNLYRTRKPDLVLLDLTLSNFTGREVLEKLLEIDPKVKVIITTADVTQLTSDEMMGRGAMGLLYKPFSSEATLESLDLAMGKPPEEK